MKERVGEGVEGHGWEFERTVYEELWAKNKFYTLGNGGLELFPPPDFKRHPEI